MRSTVVSIGRGRGGSSGVRGSGSGSVARGKVSGVSGRSIFSGAAMALAVSRDIKKVLSGRQSDIAIMVGGFIRSDTDKRQKKR